MLSRGRVRHSQVCTRLCGCAVVRLCGCAVVAAPPSPHALRVESCACVRHAGTRASTPFESNALRTGPQFFFAGGVGDGSEYSGGVRKVIGKDGKVLGKVLGLCLVATVREVRCPWQCVDRAARRRSCTSALREAKRPSTMHSFASGPQGVAILGQGWHAPRRQVHRGAADAWMTRNSRYLLACFRSSRAAWHLGPTTAGVQTSSGFPGLSYGAALCELYCYVLASQRSTAWPHACCRRAGVAPPPSLTLTPLPQGRTPDYADLLRTSHFCIAP